MWGLPSIDVMSLQGNPFMGGLWVLPESLEIAGRKCAYSGLVMFMVLLCLLFLHLGITLIFP